MNMKRHLLLVVAFTACMLTVGRAFGQLSKNPDKFLGNITTRGQVEGGGEKYYTLWNQITPENETKWSSVQGNRSSFNWGGADNAYNYAKQHKFPFKFHCFVWGSQYPSWIESLTPQQRYDAIVAWMDAAKKHFPDLQLIDVVNEAIPGHQQGTHFFEEALGGSGKTGYDWIIKAFELASERWPDAILIYNDFNTFQWQKAEFIDLVRTLRDAGAPIDAYGCQSHDLTDMSATNFKSAMTEIQNALKMPMYISEYDIGTSDDNKQKTQVSTQFPLMWEADYCAGVTFWGYIYGATWTTDGNSGLIRDGKDRPAMTWLRSYMKTEKAQNVKSPFPGMVKEASVYVKPKSIRPTVNEPTTITVNARMRTKTIDHVELYAANKLIADMKEAPYVAEYTPTTKSTITLKAVVYTTDSTKYERLSRITAVNPRSPYKEPIPIPGILQCEDFDNGGEGVSWHDTDTKNEGTTRYRTGIGGVDIVEGNGGYAIGYTSTGEWLEYTVDVKEAGLYSIDATGSAGSENASFRLSLADDDNTAVLSDNVVIPCIVQGSWDNYSTVHHRLIANLPEGTHIIHLDITGSQCNLDKIQFNHIEVDNNIKLSLSANPSPAEINELTDIIFNASSSTSTIVSGRLYINNVLVGTAEGDPLVCHYKPTTKGAIAFTAVVVDAEGRESKFAKFNLTVNPKRVPFKELVIPGIIEAEDFDKGGEGFTFHASDSKNNGVTTYRTDTEGVDILKITGGYAVGNTKQNEWQEYTVNVMEEGKYYYEITYASSASAKFSLQLHDDGKLTSLGTITAAGTGGTSTYKSKEGQLYKNLTPGKHIIRISYTTNGINFDKIAFPCTTGTEENAIEEVASAASGCYKVYSTTGVYVGDVRDSGDAGLASQIRKIAGSQGIFIAVDAQSGTSRRIMVR